MLEPVPTVRLYLSAPGDDLATERQLFAETVLPELQRKAAGFGVQVEGIDAERFPPEDRGLARRLQEIESCLPFFVAFLGERAGAPVAIPADLTAAHPWLELCADRGLQEIEIFFAVFQRRAGRSFFYRRDPSFLSEIPEEERRRFLPADGVEAARAAALETRLRTGGRPFLDGYSFRWQSRSNPAAALSGLAERLIADLWAAILEEVIAARIAAPAPTAQAQAVHLPPERPLPLHEDVQFTVYRPRAVRPLDWTPLLAFAHLGELPPGADPRDHPIRQVEQRARAILGDRIETYAPVTQDSSMALPEEAEITFVLDLPGFQVKAPRRTFLWVNAVHLEEFQIRAGADLDGQTARGSLGVYHGSILLAEVRLAVRVDAQAPQQVRLDEAPVRATPFRKIFASYSHKDAPIVAQVERIVETLGDRYLRDVRELRAGENWSERLCDFIREADVFQLFWSHNAMTSRFVEQEWRYALALGRPEFIRPTYWEDPMPAAPGLPPEELGQIHFHPLGKTLSFHEPLVPAAAPDLDDTVAAAPAAAAPDLDDTAVALPSLVEPAAAPSRPAAAKSPFPRHLYRSFAALLVLGLIGGVWFKIFSKGGSSTPSTVSAPESPSDPIPAQPEPVSETPVVVPVEVPPAVSVSEEAPAKPAPRPSPPILEVPPAAQSAPPRPQAAPPRPQAAPPRPQSAPRPAPSAPLDWIEEPVLLAFPSFQYPEAARSTNQEARVTVRVLVGTDGAVLKSELIGEKDEFGFSQEAIAAALRAQFDPATRNGTPEPRWTTLIFEFKPEQ